MKTPRLLLAGLITFSCIETSLIASQIWAWGDNTYGQLNLPSNLGDTAAISSGRTHGLALRADGNVVAWGDNRFGQTNVPPTATNVVAISASADNSYALRADGTVVAWGNNTSSQLEVPPTLSGVVAISSGYYYCLALRADHRVVGWGDNLYGQTSVPPDLTNAVAVSASGAWCVALRADGSLKAWGINPCAPSGPTLYGGPPIPDDLTNAVAISAGDHHILALLANRTVRAFGCGWYGETNVPPDLTNVVAVSAGMYSSYALKPDGTVVSWGQETELPAGLIDVTAIDAPYPSSLNMALTTRGTVTNLTQTDLETALQGGGNVVFGVGGTLSLSAPLAVTKDTTLDANGHTVTISGVGAVRLFEVATNVQFWAKGLVLTDGAVIGTNGPSSNTTLPGGDAFGAGILNLGGKLILTDCALSNHTVQGGDAAYVFGGFTNTGNGGKGFGAAIYSIGGSLSVTNCSLIQNVAKGGNGSYNSPPSVYFGPGSGGAIYCESGRVELSNVTANNNQTFGAGILTGGAGTSAIMGEGAGGAVFATNSIVLITASTFENNRSTGGGQQGHIGTAKVTGDGLGGALFIAQSSVAQVELSRFSSNSVVGGRGYHDSPCADGKGGAIFNAATLRVSACTFAGGNSMGGSYAILGGHGKGGALFSTGNLSVDASTFVINAAIGGQTDGPFYSHVGGNGEGGAIWSSGLLNATNVTLVSNGAVGGQTLSGAAPGAAFGGAILVTNGTVALVNVTIDQNGAYSTNASHVVGPPPPPDGPGLGGGLFSTNATVLVRNSIIGNSDRGGDTWGTVMDGGYNICSDATAQFTAHGSLNSADPMLLPFSQNGGPTATMALQQGSPAIDAIPSGFPPVDQRGIARPQGPAADIGAYEGGGPITELTQDALEAALQAGGTVVFGVSGTVPLSRSLTIAKDTTLDASGHSVTISGGATVRLFQVASNVQFWAKGLVLADGAVAGTNAFGGGMLNLGGRLILTDCTLSNNTVQGSDPAGNGRASGAALYSLGGTLSLTNCTLTGNVAKGGLPVSYPASAPSGPAWGGAIYCEDSRVELANVAVANNVAVGVGFYSFEGAGGGLFATNSVVLVTGSTFQNNRSGGNSSIGVVVTDKRAGDGLGGGLFIAQSSVAQVELSLFSSNSAVGGSGYHTSPCADGKGGAIFNAGTLRVSACTFAGGKSSGGVLATLGGHGYGGALFSIGDLSIETSTFVANAALGGQTDAGFYSGHGGSSAGGAIWSSGLLNATNVTLVSNGAVGGWTMSGAPPGAAFGGAILVTNGTATLVNVTIAQNGAYSTNTSTFGGQPLPGGPQLGGGLMVTNAIVTSRNSIIAKSDSGGDVGGNVVDNGYNICSDSTAQFTAPGSLNGTDPMLTALAQNGGPTPTMALLEGSPALDAIPAGFPPVDQRGFPRPYGSAADIGAFEGNPVVAPPTLTAARSGQNLTITFSAQAGRSYRLLQSVDWISWTSVATNSALSNGPVQFVQPVLPNREAFYRVVSP
jgi:hypothetical protein